MIPSDQGLRCLLRPMRLAALCMLLLGCSDPTGLRRELVPGIIFTSTPGDPQVSFQLDGRSVTVSIVSYGNSCREKGEVRVKVEEKVPYASVTVLDWETVGGFCSDVGYSFEHSATFDLPDDGIIAGWWHMAVIGEDSTGHPVIHPYILAVGNGS